MKEAVLFEKSGNWVNCLLCSHYCRIPEEGNGFCLVRKNKEGVLYSLSYGKSTGLCLDPIEKKPFYHFKPGSFCLSFGTPGCNMRCSFCQNWSLSQGQKEIDAISFTSPKEIAAIASKTSNCSGIAYTYSEPTIFFEYAADVVRECKKIFPKAYHVFVSNGYFSRECLELIKRKHLINAVRIDLKFFDENKYQKYCGASLQPVLDSIERCNKEKNWLHLEIICLLIPGLNDGEKELKEMVSWIAGINKEIPVHFIRFYPNYKMNEVPATPLHSLKKAKELAEKTGLEFVYLGNTGEESNTSCRKCGSILVKRNTMVLTKLNEKGECIKCGEKNNIII